MLYFTAVMAAMVLSSCGKDEEGGTADANKPSGLSGKVYSYFTGYNRINLSNNKYDEKYFENNGYNTKIIPLNGKQYNLDEKGNGVYFPVDKKGLPLAVDGGFYWVP